MSKQYNWSEYSVAYGGRVLEGVTGFENTTKQEKDFLYGRGNKPHQVLRGNKSFEGRLKIWQSELERMIADAPNNDVLKLKFNLTEAFVPEDGGQTVINTYVDMEITEVPRAFNQGDKNMIIELPVIYLDVKVQQ
jgi:hypothetical protein